MEEWTEPQILQQLAIAGQRMFIYFYTPMCGTCKVTEKMLQIILTMRPELPVIKCNINFCRELTHRWQLESVPCIVSVMDGQLTDKRYTMYGVDDLLRWFGQFEADENGSSY